jgi:membrane-bound metal-dependent hydrolase YbcI (DUF457 family)
MEPITHALVSFSIARAGQRRLPRFGTTMLVATGVVPDLDYASYFAGPAIFMRMHRSAMHSLAGGALTACLLAGLFCAIDKKISAKRPASSAEPPDNFARKTFAPLAFRAAVAVCAIGILAHVLLDLVSGVGVQLLWPVHTRWFGVPLAPQFDLWILLLLIAGTLLPPFFKLVNEEVGDHQKSSGRVGAGITLVLLAAYFCARADFHSQAVGMLLGREYRGEIALAAGAFPASSNPLEWRGLAVTDNTIEEAEVSAGANAGFDTERTLTYYKPGESPALDAAEKTEAAGRFLQYAKFPLATVARREAGYRVEIRDLRFPAGDFGADNIVVRVDLDSDTRVREQELRFASEASP